MDIRHFCTISFCLAISLLSFHLLGCLLLTLKGPLNLLLEIIFAIFLLRTVRPSQNRSIEFESP
jgi:hypothetical protein